MVTLSRLTLTCGMAAALLCAASPAKAQQLPEGWSVSVGAVGMYAPVFLGSDDYAFSVLPDVRVKYRESFFASVPEGVGYNLITRQQGENGWKLGPLVKLNMGRDDNGESFFALTGDSDALVGMGDIDTAFEVGGFADYQMDRLQGRVELRRGFGGHEGVVADAELNYQNRVGSLAYKVGPRATWASSDYMDTFFGVNTAQAAATGLTAYRAKSGLATYGIGASAIMPMSDRVTGIGFAAYEHLGKEAEDSSLIRVRGSDTQFKLGVGLSYRLGQ